MNKSDSGTFIFVGIGLLMFWCLFMMFTDGVGRGFLRGLVGLAIVGGAVWSFVYAFQL